jgi:hypothetical protein
MSLSENAQLLTHVTHCHTREGGCPVSVILDSRLRGNDKRLDLRQVSYREILSFKTLSVWIVRTKGLMTIFYNFHLQTSCLLITSILPSGN